MRNGHRHISPDFMAAGEIRRLGHDWVRCPVERLRGLKNAGKQLCDIRFNLPEVAGTPAFREADKAMHEVCDALVAALTFPQSAFAANYQVNWKMSTLLSRMGRYEEALIFVERAARLVPAQDQWEADDVDNKMAGILIELHKRYPLQGHGERALVIARELFLRSRTPEDRRLLGKALKALGREEEANGVFHGSLSVMAIQP